MNYQEDDIFAQGVEDIGGALSFESLDNKSERSYLHPLNTLNELLNRFKSSPKFNEIHDKIKIGYVCNPLPNAIVRKFEDHYIIGIFSGLVDTLSFAVNSLFASGKTFPDVGSPFSELSHQVLDINSNSPQNTVNIESSLHGGFKINIEKSLNLSIWDTNTNYNVASWPSPLDITRSEVAHLIICHAIEFVFLHELSHVVCGHLELSSNSSNGFQMNDGGVKMESEKIFSRDKYFLEIDADMMAFQLIYGSGLILPKDNSPSFLDVIRSIKKDGDVYEYTTFELNGPIRDKSWLVAPSNSKRVIKKIEDEDYVYFWCIAINLLLFLFLQKEINIVNWTSKTHPHPFFRIINILHGITYLKFENENFRNIYAKEWFASVRSLTEIWDSYKIPGIQIIPDIEGRYRELIDLLSDYVNFVVKGESTVYAKMKEKHLRAVGESLYSMLYNGKY